MILSMTGYGKAERMMNGTSIAVEIRSLNSRYLDLNFRAPRIFLYRENEVRERLKKKLERGKITLSVNVQSTNENLANLRIDHTIVSQYVRMLREAAATAGIDTDIRLEHLLSFTDIFSTDMEDEHFQQLWKQVVETIDGAVEQMHLMRQKEGAELSKDLLMRVAMIDRHLDTIDQHARSEVQVEFEKLQERVAKLLEKTDLDPQRMKTEIAILADRVDITEELVRFRSHNKMFRSLVEGPDEHVGRRLNFITQEMGREANTIGSKSSLPDVIHTVVSIKEEIEKLREQIQNVE